MIKASKRTLRTNELPLTVNGSLEIELQLNFCLQVNTFDYQLSICITICICSVVSPLFKKRYQ